MTVIFNWEMRREGLFVTSLKTNEDRLEIPSELSGEPVVGLGGRFLLGCTSSLPVTLRIPSTVRFADPDALTGVPMLKHVVYDGELGDFTSMRLECEGGLTLSCTDDGRPVEFRFVGGSVMSFPEYDDFILEHGYRMEPETAIARLIDPVGLSEDNRERYAYAVRNRIVPMAEHAVVSNDPVNLGTVLKTGLLTDPDLRNLLERSVGSGKTTMTALLMSEIRRRALEGV